jgi:hypothetical protein
MPQDIFDFLFRDIVLIDMWFAGFRVDIEADVHYREV